MPGKIMTADGYVTPQADPGAGGVVYIKSIVGHAQGVTIGDRIALRNGGPAASVACEAVAGSANGDFGQTYAGRGMPCILPIYYSELKSGGSFTTEIVWG